MKMYYRKREDLFAQRAMLESDLQSAPLPFESAGKNIPGPTLTSAVGPRGVVERNLIPKIKQYENARDAFDAFDRASVIPGKYREIKQLDGAIQAAKEDIGIRRDLKINDAVEVAQRQREMINLQQTMQQKAAELESLPAGKLTPENVAQHIDILRWLDDSRGILSTGPTAGETFGAKQLLNDGTTISKSDTDQFAALAAGKPSLERDVTLNLIEKAHTQAGDLIFKGSALRDSRAILDAAKNSDFGHIVVHQMLDGWETIAKTGIAVPPEVRAMLQNLITLRDPKKWAAFTKAWDSYNNVFKAYATLSPRFHLRNAMSAAFMNFADGVSGKNMSDGVSLWRNFAEDPNNWTSKLKGMSDAQIKEIDDAITAVFMSGGGQYQEISQAGRGTRNRLVKLSKRVGTTVEGSVRLGMALDTIRNGGSVDEAAARISRIHFDYTNISDFDRSAKRIIPFYTFMRYNLPMQVQMMWSKPKAYAIYMNFVRNFKGEDNEIVPSSMSGTEMFKAPFGSDLYVNADLGFSRIESDLKMIADPLKFVGSTSPLLKVPIELWADKQFYENIPLDSNKFIPLSGVSAMLAPVLEGMGVVETNAQGQKVISQKTLYAVQQLFPYGSTIDRLSGVGSQADRQMSNIAGFIGLPLKQVTAGQRKGDLYARLNALQALQEKQRALGY